MYWLIKNLLKIKSIYLYWKYKNIQIKTMNKLILFKCPVSYAKLKGAFEDVIENFITTSDIDYKNQVYWLKRFHRILMGKIIVYRDTVNDLDNQMYIEYLFDCGFYGKICLYDGVQTKGPVTLTDETMINGICVVAPKSLNGEYNKPLYEILIKMGNFIKNSLETDNNLICYSVDWGYIELLVFLGALPYFQKTGHFWSAFFKSLKFTHNHLRILPKDLLHLIRILRQFP